MNRIQGTLLVLYAMSTLLNLLNHGKERPAYNGFTAMAKLIIGGLIWWWAGLFTMNCV